MKNREIFPKYVESDLQSQVIKAPPRNRKKEVNLYFYKTNQLTKDIIDPSVSAKIIQPVYDSEFKFFSTTPLNPDIASPKFQNISESATWGSQINGFIYTELDWDSNFYSFMSFVFLQNDTISLSVKYRIVNYQPIFDNNNNFIYASIVLVKEDSNTIPNLDRVTWRLTSTIIIDAKTKFLKIVLPNNALILNKGIIVSVLDDAGLRRISGLISKSLTPLVYKMIKVRNTNPFIFDDLTFQNFKEQDGVQRFQENAPGKTKWLYLVINEAPSPFAPPADFPNSPPKTIDQIDLNMRADINIRASGFVDYFSNGLIWTGKNGDYLSIKEFSLTPQEMDIFIAGSKTFDGETIPYDTSNFIIAGETKKLSDLNKGTVNDRKYFVLAKKTNFLKMPFVSISGDIYSNNPLVPQPDTFTGIYWRQETQTIDTGQRSSITIPKVPEETGKVNLIRHNEFVDQLINEDKITLEFELSFIGKNPQIEIQIASDDIEITTYDENNRILLDSIKLDTEFKFNNDNKRTVIQL